MRASSNIVGGSFFGADLEPGTFHHIDFTPRSGFAPGDGAFGEGRGQQGGDASSAKRPSLPPDGDDAVVGDGGGTEADVADLVPGAAAA